MEIAHRIDQQNQSNLDVWQQLAINLKCMIYWKYLLRDMEVVLSWTIDQRLSSHEYSRLMNDLENNYDEFIKMSQDATVLDADEMVKLRQDYNTTVKHFENVLEAWEGQRSTAFGNTGSGSSSSGRDGSAPIIDIPVKVPALNSTPVDTKCLNSMSVRLGDCEDRLLQLIQTQLRSGDPLLESETRLEEVQVHCRELTDLKDQLEVLERDSAGLPQDSWRLLAKLSEKGRRLVDLGHTARDDLKIVDQLVSSVSETDNMLRSYEVRVAEENTPPSSLEGVHAHNMLLKQWRSELEQKDRLFRAMQDELVQATSVSERLNQQQSLHYPDVRPYGDRTRALNERRDRLFTQINSRVKVLGDLGRLLKPYRDSSQILNRWLTEATARQRAIQDLYVKDSRTLTDQLNQQQNLLHEVESNKSRVDQCQEFSEKCSNMVQAYEKDLASYRLWVEKFHSTSIVPHKQTSLSEIVTEEYMDIQQRYNALMAMTSKQLRYINDMSGKIGEEEFLRDVRKLEDLLNQQKENMHRSYSCDRVSKLPRIEAAVRDMPMVQKEILQYQRPVREVMSKASNIDQKMHADRVQQLYDDVLSLWKDQQADANSLQWWIRLQENINTVRAWTPTSFGKLSSDQQRETMHNLESNYEALQKNMYGAKVLGLEDRSKSDNDVRFCRQHYRDLLTKMEKVKQEDTMCQHYLDRLRAMEPQLDKYREQTLQHLHAPLTATPSLDAQQRVMSQERIQRELSVLKETTEAMNQECGELLCQLSESPRQIDLQTTLNGITRRLDNLHGLSTGTLDDLKALEAMMQKFEEMDSMVKKYESRLVESSAIPGREDEAAMARRNLKQWQGDLYQWKTLQGTIEDAIQRATLASERLKRSHNENDLNVEAYQGKVKELGERRKRVQNNVDSRLGELDGLERNLQTCGKQQNGMSRWLGDAEGRLERLKSERLEDEQVVSQMQGQLKNLSSEIRLKQPQMDEMQKVSETCCSSIKDYEQLLKKFADEVSKQGKPLFARVPSQSPADDIRKETKELRNRYDSLQGKAEQLIKSLLDAQQKLKDDEFMRMACELEKNLHDTEDTLNSRFSADGSTSSARLTSLLREMQNVQQTLVTYNVRIGQLGAKVKTAEHRNTLHGLQQQYDKLAQQSEESTSFLQNLLALQDLDSKTRIIRAWTLDTFKALPSGEANRAVGEMDKSYRNLLEAAGTGGRRLSQAAKGQAESEVSFCQQHYRTLLNELDIGSQRDKLEHDCLASLSAVRLRCDDFEDRISQKVHTLLGPSAVAENGQRIAQVQRIQKDIDEANEKYLQVKTKVTAVLTFPKGSAMPDELQKTNYCLEHVHNMASLASQEMILLTSLVEAFEAAEPPIRTLEARLVEAETCPDDPKAVEKYKATLKQWLAQAKQKHDALSALDRQLREARSVNDRLTEQFGPRDPNLESFRDRTESLQVRWRDAQTQVDVRLQDLDELSRRMQNVHTTQASLEPWLCQATARQENIELPRLKDSKGFAENVQAHKKLLDEVEKNGIKIDDCQKQSEDFSSAMKNYEVRLMTYRALVERHQNVPAKRGVRSPSETVTQQYVDQRTRYNSLLTMMRHYLKLMNEQMSQNQENEFMREATEVEMHVRLIQDTIKSKYAVDSNASISRLESLSHDIKMDENKLPEYKRKIDSLSSRAKLPAESSKVQSLNRIHSEILILLNNSRNNLTAFLAWQRVLTETRTICGWTTETIRSKSNRDMEQALVGMDRQHAKFVQVSSCAPAMGAGERTVAEQDVSAAKKHYQSLKEKQGNESQQAEWRSEWQVSVQRMRPRLENCNDRTSRILRQRLERDPPSENGNRIRQQLEVEAEAESLQEEFMQLKQMAAKLPLNVQTEQQTLCKSAEKMKAYAGLALEELQCIDPVLSGLVEAEKLVQDQELKLCSGKSVPCEVHELESYISDLKSSRVKFEGRTSVIMMLKEKLAMLRTLNDRLMSSHGQMDVNFSFCQNQFDMLQGRWDDATAQVETRLQQLRMVLNQARNCSESVRVMSQLTESSTSKFDQFNRAASETPEEIMDTLQHIEELRIEILNSKKRGDHLRYTEDLAAALKKLETLLITYRSRIEQFHITLPQQVVNGNEMYRKEIADLQLRLTTLESSLAQAVTMLTDRQHRAERIRSHKITRHVRIIVDGEEMAMVDAFRSGLISEEKFIELANWQGEQTITEEC
uniref:microtubule-actin cross-linking factor 1-like n=1 Tax=Myxine glutinosa TaxID=7769 RepID=UPI0035901E5B